MSCDCREDIEAKLLARFKEQAPDAKEHAAELKGYGMVIREKIVTIGCMPIEMTAEHPLKNGGFKRKIDRQSMFFNYCPFCGKKYSGEPV